MVFLYSISLFVSAFLLFSVQPMVGKMILPKFGGTSSVWNTCMVFFQMLLLVGYAYAHWSIRVLGVRRQSLIHMIILLLPLAVLPIYFGEADNPPSGQNPSFWLLGQLALVVGLPFFVVSSSAPLLQQWYTKMRSSASEDPYFLYSVSNAGSLVALIGYPFLIEPNASLTTQSYLWLAGYILLVVLVFSCAFFLRRTFGITSHTAQITERLEVEPLEAEKAPDRIQLPVVVGHTQRIKWVLLAMVPSSLMLGVTTHITTDLASVPLLWMIPLALYLLSFIIVFARKPIISQNFMARIMVYALLLIPIYFLSHKKVWLPISVHLITFFIVCIVCHGELARSRPSTRHLTEFYLLMSLGGVLGGAFNSLLAPQLFDYVLEYPIMLVASCFLRPSRIDPGRPTFWRHDCLWLAGLALLVVSAAWFLHTLRAESLAFFVLFMFAIPTLICFRFRRRTVPFGIGIAIIFTGHFCVTLRQYDILYSERNFFGVKHVGLDSQKRLHVLINGNVIHGTQQMYPQPSHEPLAYYHRESPIGNVFNMFARVTPKPHVAVVGLGVGTLASYAESNQHITFYEIDPSVRLIATNPAFFTFLNTCRGDYNIVLGDARIEIAKAPEGQFGIIVLDAFSSDSIPSHLLTREALAIYSSKLENGGIIVYHISNRFLNLEPMLAALAEEAGMVCLSRKNSSLSAQDQRDGKIPSHYLVMAQSERDIEKLAQDSHWSKPAPLADAKVWTDDYSPILGLLRW